MVRVEGGALESFQQAATMVRINSPQASFTNRTLGLERGREREGEREKIRYNREQE
jgi:hypothetical protein